MNLKDKSEMDKQEKELNINNPSNINNEYNSSSNKNNTLTSSCSNTDKDLIELNQNADFLNLKDNQKLLKLIRDEVLLLTDAVNKINNYGFKKKRLFIITNKAIYNLKTNLSLRRRTEFKYVQGVSVSKQSLEFVIHCSDIEHDFWYISDKRTSIIEVLSYCYKGILKHSMKICELDHKSLKNYVTSKKEKYKDLGYSKMPDNYVTSKIFLVGNMSSINFENEEDVYGNIKNNKNSIHKEDCIKTNANNINNKQKASIASINSNNVDDLSNVIKRSSTISIKSNSSFMENLNRHLTIRLKNGNIPITTSNTPNTTNSKNSQNENEQKSKNNHENNINNKNNSNNNYKINYHANAGTNTNTNFTSNKKLSVYDKKNKIMITSEIITKPSSICNNNIKNHESNGNNDDINSTILEESERTRSFSTHNNKKGSSLEIPDEYDSSDIENEIEEEFDTNMTNLSLYSIRKLISTMDIK